MANLNAIERVYDDQMAFDFARQVKESRWMSRKST
jgi:hypothetical protein